MTEGKPRLVRFWPCACWGSPSFVNGSAGEYQSETITRTDLKQTTINFSKNRKKQLHRHGTPAPPLSSNTTTTNLSNKVLGHNSRHFELGNSSEEGGYIQAISPTPSSAHHQGSRHNLGATTTTTSPRPPFSRAAATPPFSPPACCATVLERLNNKQPKYRLQDSWDGLVVLHSPKTQQGNDEEEEEQRHQNNHHDGNYEAETSDIGASPRLLNNHHRRNHFHSPSHRNLSPHLEENQDSTTASTSAGTATAVNNAFEAQLQGPLATPQSLLEEISRLVAINDQKHVISALALLSRGVKHHNNRLEQCLGELLAVVTACLQSSDDQVVSHALVAATELVKIYGDLLLQHMYAQQQQQTQDEKHNDVFLLQLLHSATRSSSSSPSSASEIKSAADTLLRRIASKMHQASIIKLLEPLAARSGDLLASSSGGGRSNRKNTNTNTAAVQVQNKAASILLIATYRLS